MIHKVRLNDTGQVVEIDDDTVIRDPEGYTKERYYIDWHGFVAEHYIDDKGRTIARDIGKIEE